MMRHFCTIGRKCRLVNLTKTELLIFWERPRYYELMKKYYTLIAITLIFLGFAFYWFQLRPAQIRKDCSKLLTSRGGGLSNAGLPSGKNAYDYCLLRNGLEK